jgi:hypothetical protein
MMAQTTKKCQKQTLILEAAATFRGLEIFKKITDPQRDPLGGGAPEAKIKPQDDQIEPRRLKWSPGDPNGAQEAQMEPRKPK